MEKEYLQQKYTLMPLEDAGTDRMKVVMFTNNIDPKSGKLNASITGMMTRDGDNSVPFIDAHNEYGSIVKVLLGRVFDIHNGTHEGLDAKIGYIEFAKTESGRDAEILYRSGIARDVSIGIYFYPNDVTDEGYIEKSELSELSGVVVGADRRAKVVQTAQLEKPNLEKLVANYNDIKPKIKQYREVFMADSLFGKLELEKTGDELQDIINLSTKLIQSLEEAEESEAETPTEEVDEETETPTPQAETQRVDLITKAEALEYLNSLKN